MSKACSAQLGWLGKHKEMQTVESQQSWDEVQDLLGGIKSCNRKCSLTKRRLVNYFGIDHATSLFEFMVTQIVHKWKK